MLEHLFQNPIPPKRVVVIGAGGFVGRAISSRIVKTGVPVVGLTRKDLDLLSPNAIDFLSDLLREDDAVVAVAAIAPCKTPEMLRDNLLLSLTLVRAFEKAHPAHVVNISSDAVFADAPLPLTENSPKAPGSYHGTMHLVRETMFFNEISSPLAILRPTLIYGANDPHNGYGPNLFRRKAKRGEPLVLFGEGEERRDHVFVEDVAEIVFRTLFHRSVGSLNVATGVVASFREIAEKVVKISGKGSVITGSIRNAPMPHGGYRPFDISACREAFPDFRYTQLAEGLTLAQNQEFPNE